MTYEERDQVYRSGVELAIQRGYDARTVQRIAGHDWQLQDFKRSGMRQLTPARIADYIINIVGNPDDDDGGASQADWSPGGCLASLESTLRGGG